MKKIKYILFIIPLLILTSCSNKVIKVSTIRNVSYDTFSISETNMNKALKSTVSLSDSNATYFFSGVVIKENVFSYYIATYGVQANSSNIKLTKATIYDGSTVNVSYVGTDIKNNIAVYEVLKLSADLEVAKGYTEALEKGMNIMSVSTPLISDTDTLNTVKTGIISNTALGIFGTSVELCFSEIGAPIYNTDGKLLGITTSIISTSQTASSLDELIKNHVTGLNQATTYELLNGIANDIISANSDVSRGMMGVTVTNYENAEVAYSHIINPSDTPYVTIIAVSEGSAADKANIRAGYYITKIDGHSISRLSDLNYYMARKNKGDQVKLTCLNEVNTEIEYRLVLK